MRTMTQPRFGPESLSLLVCGTLLFACSHGDSDNLHNTSEDDRWEALDNGVLVDCIHMSYIAQTWGGTIAGPYTPYALSDFARADTGGAYRALSSPDGDTCGQEIARRLLRLCNEAWVCGRYGNRSLCLYAIEDSFRRPFPHGICDVCGDGYCGQSEAVRPNEGGPVSSCPEDCTCGNGTCEPSRNENLYACPTDCPSACGDGLCTGGEICGECPAEGSGAEPIVGFFGEITMPCATCAVDCCQSACGDRVCVPDVGESATDCPQDCAVTYCGDDVCIGLENETNCPVDCGGLRNECGDYCADGACGPFSAQLEKRCDTHANCLNCENACGDPRARCGDGACMGCEMWTCAMDCSESGFGHCTRGEDGTLVCPERWCGDGECTGDVENRTTCPQDCPYAPDPAACENRICELEDFFNGCAAIDCTAALTPATCGDGYCMRGEGLEIGGDVLIVCPQDCGGAQ